MASVAPLFVFLLIVLGLNAAAVLVIPKGPHQILIRTSVMLSLTGCYLLWAITYLAQLHPLIAPTRKLVPE